MEKNGIWEEQWKVAAFMVDTQHRIRLRSIADIFQELANNHANYRKCGFEDMKASGKFWVLNRQTITITEWPIWEQELYVESWISMMKGPFSLRHFAIFDKDQRIMVKASYLWTSIDRQKMKPTAIPDGEFPIIEQRDFDLPQPQKIKIDGQVKKTFTYEVRDSDLDIIGHTNNAVYLQWAMDILAGNEMDIHQIETNYTGESLAGQRLGIQLLQDENNQWSVGVQNEEDQQIFKLKFS